jgi:hypothetical protein
MIQNEVVIKLPVFTPGKSYQPGLSENLVFLVVNLHKKREIEYFIQPQSEFPDKYDNDPAKVGGSSYHIPGTRYILVVEQKFR